jgi:hypothetical protein
VSDSDQPPLDRSREPIKVIGELLRKELNLEPKSAVLMNEKMNIQTAEIAYGPGPYSGQFGGSGEGAKKAEAYGPQSYEGPYGGPGLYLSLGVVSSKGLANNLYYRERDDGGFDEVQETVLDEIIRIELLSWDGSARADRHKVMKALNSTRAQNLMELYGIQIARMPLDFVNTSSLETTKILNRYTATVRVKSLTRTIKAVDYYDKFPLTSVPIPEVIAL